MKNRTQFGLAAASLVAIAGSASATTIGQFTTAGGTGVTDMQPYIGGGGGVSGNNFALESATGISLGLKSHNRFAGDWGPAELSADGRAVYTAERGAGPGGSSNPTKWSYLWAVDFAAGLNAGDYTVRVHLDFDSADGDATDMMTIEYPLFDRDLDSANGFQLGDSQSMGFDFYDAYVDGANEIVPGYSVNVTNADAYLDIDPNAVGRYDVSVEVYQISTDSVVAGVDMSVVVVPLPPAALAGLAGLAGAAVMRRRFRG